MVEQVSVALFGGLQLVEEARRDDLAGEAVPGEVGGDRKRLDDEAAVVVGLPGHDAEADDHEQADGDREQLKADPQAVAEMAEREMAVGEGQMAVLEGAVHFQILDLKVHQPPLVVQEGRRFGVDLVRPRAPSQRHAHRGRGGLRPSLVGFARPRFVVLRHARPSCPRSRVFQRVLAVKPSDWAPRRRATARGRLRWRSARNRTLPTSPAGW